MWGNSYQSPIVMVTYYLLFLCKWLWWGFYVYRWGNQIVRLYFQSDCKGITLYPHRVIFHGKLHPSGRELRPSGRELHPSGREVMNHI